MSDMRAELGLWVDRIETILRDRGIPTERDQLETGIEHRFPKQLEDDLNGFIENPIELIGLLEISRDARDGRPISPAVLMAAHLMAREVLQALLGTGDAEV